MRKVGEIFKRRGHIKENLDSLSSGELGKKVAEGMLSFNRSIGFPTTLKEIEGIDKSVIDKILEAAKNPQLESKLRNMPAPLTSNQVDQYMGPVLEAAWEGDLSKIVLQ